MRVVLCVGDALQVYHCYCCFGRTMHLGPYAEYLSVHSTRLHVYKLDYKINFFVSLGAASEGNR